MVLSKENAPEYCKKVAYLFFLKEASGEQVRELAKGALVHSNTDNYKKLSGKAPMRRVRTLSILQKLKAGCTSEPGHQLTKTEMKSRRDQRVVQLMHPLWKRSHTKGLAGWVKKHKLNTTGYT